MPRQSAFGRLLRHFHEHPKGRLHEFLFWAGIGLVIGALAFVGWRTGAVSDPMALLASVVAICFVGWALLPRARTKAPPPLPGGKRGEAQRKLREAKAQHKKKENVPPGPPIRRG